MILFVVFAGLYLITVVGYYKMMFRTRELSGPDTPFLLKATVGILALFWWVVIIWSLIVEAVKT
jgi:hypothetical protein